MLSRSLSARAVLDEPWISQGCRYPRQQQAEIIESDRNHRHPVEGGRPEWSGYCVLPDKCGCTAKGCHGPGKDSVIVEVKS